MRLAALNIDQTKGELPRSGITYHNSSPVVIIEGIESKVTETPYLTLLHKLHFDAPKLIPDRPLAYQPVRIARLAAVPIANCSSGTILTPLATMSCVSLGRPTLAQSRTPSPASLQLILQCAFCGDLTTLQDVLASARTAESVQRTAGLLVALATKHGERCRGRVAPELLKDDDVHLPVAEGITRQHNAIALEGKNCTSTCNTVVLSIFYYTNNYE